MVKRRDQKVTLKVNDGPKYVDSHEEHYTTSCTEGTSWMLVGYSSPDSAKLKMEAIDLLEELGFKWDSHLVKKETSLEGQELQ